jgi:hypothetical protein
MVTDIHGLVADLHHATHDDIVDDGGIQIVTLNQSV